MFLTLLLILGLVLICTIRPALSGAKPREFLVDVPTIEQRVPVAAGAVIHAGAYLEWTGGAVTPLSGAGVFAGIARESATGGAADGDVMVLIRSRGGLRVAVGGGDVTALTIVGVAATVPEATDDDTVRIETAAAITGTVMGTFMAALAPLGANGKVDISFKGAHIT